MRVDILNISINSILYTKNIDADTLYFESLLESISRDGILVKPVVIKNDEITYLLEDGHLRIEALKRLGFLEVRAVVFIPEEYEKKEDVKAKISDILLVNCGLTDTEKLSAPYFEQPKLFLNLTNSLGKVREDFNFIHSNLVTKAVAGIEDNNKRIYLVQNKSNEINEYLKQKISLIDVSYNMENLIKAQNKSNNIYLSKILFSKDYMEQTISSSNNIIAFCDKQPDVTKILGKNSVLSDYVAKVVNNISQTTETLKHSKVNFQDFVAEKNNLVADNKLFKLRNLNSFSMKYLSLTNNDGQTHTSGLQQNNINLSNIEVKNTATSKKNNHINGKDELSLINIEKVALQKQNNDNKTPDTLKFLRGIGNARKLPLLEISDLHNQDTFMEIGEILRPSKNKPKNTFIAPVVLDSVREINALINIIKPRNQESININPNVSKKAQEIKALVKASKPSIQEPINIISSIREKAQEIKALVKASKPSIQEPINIISSIREKAQEINSLVENPKPNIQEPINIISSIREKAQEINSLIENPKPNIQEPVNINPRIRETAQEISGLVKTPKSRNQEPININPRIRETAQEISGLVKTPKSSSKKTNDLNSTVSKAAQEISNLIKPSKSRSKKTINVYITKSR